MFRRPPRSTPFPTRRSSDLLPVSENTLHLQTDNKLKKIQNFRFRTYRSEEHTSELQSRFDLVCRLLLEKKNILPIQLHLTSPNFSSAPSIEQRTQSVLLVSS